MLQDQELSLVGASVPEEVFKEFFERHVDFVGELDSQLSGHSLSHQDISRDLLVRGSCLSDHRVCVVCQGSGQPEGHSSSSVVLRQCQSWGVGWPLEGAPWRTTRWISRRWRGMGMIALATVSGIATK